MDVLLNGLNTVLTAGIGGITFLGVWTYAVLRWVSGMGSWDGLDGLVGWWS